MPIELLLGWNKTLILWEIVTFVTRSSPFNVTADLFWQHAVPPSFLLLPFLHSVPATHDGIGQKSKTPSISRIHRYRLGSCHYGSRACQSMETDASSSMHPRNPRSWLFFELRLLGEHVVYSKLVFLTALCCARLNHSIGEVAKRNAVFYLSATFISGFGGILAYGVSFVPLQRNFLTS
jgi:hypothetical protein